MRRNEFCVLFNVERTRNFRGVNGTTGFVYINSTIAVVSFFDSEVSGDKRVPGPI